METERKEILQQLEILVSRKYKVPVHKPATSKSSELSIKTRNAGNKLFKLSGHTAQQHREVLNLYSKSVALAPLKSQELAFACSNRSALLFHVGEYSKGIVDVDRALAITTIDEALKTKLYCRKAKCLTLAGLPGKEEAFQRAVECFDKIKDVGNKKHPLASLIARTEMVMRSKKQEEQKYEISKTEEILTKREKQDLFNYVEMKYSGEHGRHLVTARDMRPGDVIMVEKPYVVFPHDSELSFLFCSHCLAVAPTGIPCDFCNWSIYCSEKCKEEAWKKYHEWECPIVPHLKVSQSKEPETISMCCKLAVRICMMMIKEAGGIDKLQAELKYIDADKERFKRCYSTTKLDNMIKFVYTLSSNVSKDNMNEMLGDFAKSLLSVIQFPPFSDQSNFACTSLDNLAKNERLLFTGALLLKLYKIASSNKFFVRGLSDNPKDYRRSTRTYQDLESIGGVLKGVSLQTIASFINNCCEAAANVQKFYTDSSKVVLYASEPIKKNSQIFIHYLSVYNLYNNFPRDDLKKLFGFDCKCVACQNHWSYEGCLENLESNPPMNSKFIGNFLMLQKQLDLVKSGNFEQAMSRIKKYIEDEFKAFKKPVETISSFKCFIGLAYYLDYSRNHSDYSSCIYY